MKQEMSSTHRRAPTRGTAVARVMPSEAGFSLVEGLVAAGLLLVVAVSVLPLFIRALESNTRGGRASQVSTFVSAQIEEINQASIDRPEWQLSGAGAGVRETGTVFWHLGPEVVNAPRAVIGDERWVATEAEATGLVIWQRKMDVRKYSFADVHTSIMVGTTELATLGDPRWFDSPLTNDDDGEVYDAHLTEFRVHLREDREGIPLDSGQRMTVGHFRVF